MRLQHIPWPGQVEFGAAGICSAIAAVGTTVSDVAVQIIGVPLPVVLAAAAGAFIARSYAAEVSFGRALGIVLAWTLIGCALAPLAQAVFTATAAKFGFDVRLPPNVMAGFAGIAAAAPWWVALLWPMVLKRLGIGGQESGGNRG